MPTVTWRRCSATSRRLRGSRTGEKGAASGRARGARTAGGRVGARNADEDGAGVRDARGALAEGGAAALRPERRRTPERGPRLRHEGTACLGRDAPERGWADDRRA